MVRISFHFGNIDMVSVMTYKDGWSTMKFYEPYPDDGIIEQTIEHCKGKVKASDFSNWSTKAYNQWCLEHGYEED